MNEQNMQPAKSNGFKLEIGKYKFRLWNWGFEFGNNFGGRVFFFPWTPYERQRRREKFYWWLIGMLPKQAMLFAFCAVYGADGNGPTDEFKTKYDFYAHKHGLK